MFLRSTSLVLLLLHIITPINGRDTFNVISDSSVLIKNGQQEYELLLQRKHSPLYGECWNDAISRLERNCKLLDEYRQSWLATLFTNCFLKASGFDESALGENCLKLVNYEYENLVEDDLKKCTQGIDMKMFHTYSLFYVHTQSICFYLQSEQWQKRTENLVDNLLESSSVVSNVLLQAVGNIEQLRQIQDNSLDTQQSINDQLTRSKSDMEEFQHKFKQNRDLLESVIDQFILLRHLVVVEFSLSSSIFFYLISFVVVYFITTTKQTSGIRILLYFILIVGFIVEKKWIDYVYRFDQFLFENSGNTDLNMEQFTMNRSLWLIRKTMLLIMASLYVWWFLTYRDINQINYRMLNENTKILKQIHEDLKASPEKILRLQAQLRGPEFSEDSDDDSTTTTEASFSDYSESDIEFPEIDQELENQKPRRYALRGSTSKIPRPAPTSLPKEYAQESMNDFVKNLRSVRKSKIPTSDRKAANFYSSDEDL